MKKILQKIFGLKKEKVNLKEAGYKAVEVVSNVLVSMGVKHHIDFGTLLGHVRNRDFISHDLDVDFAVYEDCDFFVLKKALIDKGLKFERCFVYGDAITEITMTYKNTTIDFFKNICQDDNQHHYFYGRFDKSLKYPHRTKQAVKCVRPAVTGTKVEKFAGLVDVAVPLNAEDLLERTYGADWRIPNPNWKCDFSSRFLTVMPNYGKKLTTLKNPSIS
jgi:hypothetical protein